MQDWLLDQLKRRGWSQRELARRAGLPQASVSKSLTGERNATADTCVKVAGALDVSPILVLTKAGIIPPQPDRDPRLEEITELIR